MLKGITLGVLKLSLAYAECCNLAMLNAVMLNAVTPNVVLTSVIMLSVGVPRRIRSRECYRPVEIVNHFKDLQGSLTLNEDPIL
jgi:hypothetical protein